MSKDTLVKNGILVQEYNYKKNKVKEQENKVGVSKIIYYLNEQEYKNTCKEIRGGVILAIQTEKRVEWNKMHVHVCLKIWKEEPCKRLNVNHIYVQCIKFHQVWQQRRKIKSWLSWTELEHECPFSLSMHVVKHALHVS